MFQAKIEGGDGITPLYAKISTPPQNGAAADHKQDDPGRATMNKRPGKRQRQKAKQEAAAAAAAASTVSTTSEIKTEARPKIDAKIGNDTKLKTDAKPKTGKNSRKSTKSKTGWILRDTGEALCSLSCTSLEPDDSTVTSASGFHVLCSYNWCNDGKVILVPGGPPKLIQCDLPVKLLPDSGMQYIDQNAFRVPKYPFEPAFQAMAFMSPGVSLDDVDIIANRNSFRKLLDFASGRRGDPWRMDLHLVNNTLFISRREKTARQMIHGAFNTGYGHNLEKTFTQPGHGLDHSSSHHRVIRYKFGLLDCVVRFEVDAYLDSPKDEASVDVDVDEVTARIGDLKMNNTAGKDVAESDTRVLRKGIFIDSSKLVELKAKKCEKLREAVAQLWFGRTPYLVTGQHKDGVVHTLSHTDVSLQFPQWEASNQTQLQKLVGVLSWLKTTITASGDKAAALVYQEKGGPLEILKMRKETSVLPEHIIAKYWVRQESTSR